MRCIVLRPRVRLRAVPVGFSAAFPFFGPSSLEPLRKMACKGDANSLQAPGQYAVRVLVALFVITCESALRSVQVNISSRWHKRWTAGGLIVFSG